MTQPWEIFTGTGMTWRKKSLYGQMKWAGGTDQVAAGIASEDDLQEIIPYLSEFAESFGKFGWAYSWQVLYTGA